MIRQIFKALPEGTAFALVSEHEFERVNRLVNPQTAAAALGMTNLEMDRAEYERLTLAESERESLHARIEELNFEKAVIRNILLPDELVQAVLDNRSVSSSVGVNAVIFLRRFAVQHHSKADGLLFL